MIIPGLSQLCIFEAQKPQHRCLFTFLRCSQTHVCEAAAVTQTSSLTLLCFPPCRCPAYSGNTLIITPTNDRNKRPVVFSDFPSSASAQRLTLSSLSSEPVPTFPREASLCPLPFLAAPAVCHRHRGLVAVPACSPSAFHVCPWSQLFPLSITSSNTLSLISTPMWTALQSTESAEPPRRPQFPHSEGAGVTAPSPICHSEQLGECEQVT